MSELFTSSTYKVNPNYLGVVIQTVFHQIRINNTPTMIKASVMDKFYIEKLQYIDKIKLLLYQRCMTYREITALYVII